MPERKSFEDWVRAHNFSEVGKFREYWDILHDNGWHPEDIATMFDDLCASVLAGPPQ